MKKIIIMALAIGMIQSAFAITVFDRDTNNTKVGGYMDTEWVSEGATNTFKAHRLIIQVGSRLNSKVRFNSEIEYEYGGFITNKDASNTTQKGELKIEQACGGP